MKNPLIEINDWSGGMTLNEKMGKANQFHAGYGLDFSSKPGYLTCGVGFKYHKAAGVDSVQPTYFPAMCYTVYDDHFWLGGYDTKIYYNNSWAVTEATDSDQAGAIRSMAEYKNYLYYIQNTTIGRKDLSQAYNAGYTHNWQTGLTSATYHPIKISANNKIYFGHGQYIASYDGTTFTANTLDLADRWSADCLEDFGYLYLAIGANYLSATGSSKCKILLWNRTDVTWNDEIIIPEDKINAMKFYAGYLWVWAGPSSNIYVIPEGSRIATKIWSFVREDPTINLIVYPNAIEVNKGTIYFGLSDSGNTATSASHPQNPTGIYSFPANPNNFSLNMVYQNQTYNERYDSLVLAKLLPDSLFASYSYYSDAAWNYKALREYNTGNNEALYQNMAVYESFRFDAPKNKKIFTEAFVIQYEPFVLGHDIHLLYKKDNETSYTELVQINGADYVNTYEKIIYKKIEFKSLKLAMYIRGSTSANTRPFIKSIFATGHLINKV